MSYITRDEFMRHMTTETLVRNARQYLKEMRESYMHEEQSHNWPPPNHELEKFKHPSCVEGYTEFVLRRDWNVSEQDVLLILFPVVPIHGALVVAKCDRNFKWSVTCDYSMVSAVAAAIPRAEAFLRNLLEQSERAKLPDDCEWFEIGNELFVRDNRSGTLFPVPTSARRADILDSVVKEFRRTH